MDSARLSILVIWSVVGSHGGMAASPSSDAKQPAPVWPAAFTAAYVSPHVSEDTLGKDTTGSFVVDTSHAASERIELLDGTRDHLCSAMHNNTPCTQLTSGGYRYLVFPKANATGDCCKCCTYASGTYLCGGPLGPQWLDNATGNLVYLGVQYIKDIDSHCHKWSVAGLVPEHPNYYYQHVESGMPCGIDGYNYLRTPDQRADDLYWFPSSQIRLGVDPQVFSVPSMCTDARYCGNSVCATGPGLMQTDFIV
eukprot:TRINITY_DN90723_c0_g1_i1.p1 TRINITY_DN90723_c0_g1~~TRINITY_DN90723_c0_g1_i1.p1  ORF type:complete len:252 (+),score=13.45 TRINITY_DN90723_c0_g1_i1:60-815(+)